MTVVFILGAIAATGCAGFIAITHQSMRLSDRTLNLNAATSLAEAGIEAGLWSINRDEWSGWTDVSGDKKKISLSAFVVAHGASGSADDPLDLNRNIRGNAEIVVYTGGAPRIVSRARVWTASRPESAVERWTETTMKSRSYFDSGLVGYLIEFQGNNACVNAYDSRLGLYDAALAAGGTNKFDTAKTGALAVSMNAFSVGNADIFGYAQCGGPDVATGIRVGPNGLVGPFGTAAGVKDPDRVSADFRAELPQAQTQSTSGATPFPSGNYPVLTGSTDPKNPVVYSSLSALSFEGGNPPKGISVIGHVALVTSSLHISGGDAYLRIAPDSSLNLYSSGNIDIAGQGIINDTNVPGSMMIHGTAPSSGTQTISIRGNGTLAAAVYAPNANVYINGNGDVMGAVVGKNIYVTGNSCFHHDLALRDMTDGQPKTVGLWRELYTIAERAPYSADF